MKKQNNKKYNSAPRKNYFDVSEGAKHFYMIFSIFCMFLPFILMLMLSLKSKKQVIYEFFSLKGPYHFENFEKAFDVVLPLIKNSFIMALCTMLLAVFLATFAGYAFGKLHFPFAKVLFGIMFIKMMLPGIANLIPSFTLAMKMNILDTYLPVILFGAGTAMPYWVFVMKTFVESQPTELFESMRLDGAGEMQIYWKMAIPLLKPMIALMSMNVFLSVWNDYIWPLVTITTPEKRPITVGISMLTSTYPGETGLLAAAYAVSSLPLLILFVVSMKQFVEGLSAGSIKL